MATIQQLATEVSKALKRASDNGDHDSNVVDLLPCISLVPDINESLLKKPGDHICMDPRKHEGTNTKIKIEAMSASSPPCFTILHLLVFHWILDFSPPKPEFYKQVSQIFSAVVQFGGDIDIPVNGIRIPFLDIHILRPTPLEAFISQDILQNPSFYFQNNAFGNPELQPRLSDLLKNIEIAKEANPFPRMAYSSSKSSALPWWSNLLLSEDFSDVTIVCKDGTNYPAHQMVLSYASQYFKTYFTGPWSKQGKRDYETDIESNIMKYILTYIYTSRSFGVSLGSIDVGCFCNILEAGHFLQMDDLVNSCCKYLKMKISLENIKRITSATYVAMNTSTPPDETTAVDTAATVATTTSASSLWDGCNTFIRQNSVKLLLDSDFGSLKDENPNLWNDLQKAILSSSSS